MADKTPIEWADASWNPVRGCTRVSEGCGGPNHEGGCYAEKVAARFSGPGQPYEGFAERTPHGGRWTGKLALIDSQLDLPLRWKRPRRIFVNSMSDLFHEALPDAAIDKVFAVMALCPQHKFLVLTKRAQRMRDYIARPARIDCIADAIHYSPRLSGEQALRSAYDAPDEWPLPNVWLGVSVEDQARADERIPLLLDTPAAIRFISAEPLLGPVDLTRITVPRVYGSALLDAATGVLRDYRGNDLGRLSLAKLDWVIAGGESGPRARPMHPDWARSLRDQSQAAGIPFFFKQWGEWIGADQLGWLDPQFNFEGREWRFDGAEPLAVHAGKRAAGRLLDGRTWSEFPA